MATVRLTILLLLITMVDCSPTLAQGKYMLNFAPDLWYNTIDGVRVGLRMKGQMAGTYGDGPHRLDAGLWLGTTLPDDPVSYYVSLTEPIPAFSDFGSEATIEGSSSVREGFQHHGVTVSKRWQRGFNEMEYALLRLTSSYSQRYDTRYALLPNLWQTQPVITLEPAYHIRRASDMLGSMSQSLHLTVGSYQRPNTQSFIQFEVDHQARKELGSGFVMGHRLFLGLSSASIPIERRYRLSGGKSVREVASGVTRSRGILPQAGLDSGWIHIADGPNLRGYGGIEMDQLTDGKPETVRNVGAINVELDYPNPATWLLSRIPVVGGLLNSRMYVFSDLGVAAKSMKSNLGAGVSVGLNIPDYLGRSRSLSLRYDVPAWLSTPDEDAPQWEFRSVLGIWSVINF